jgi:hypothetical protein
MHREKKYAYRILEGMPEGIRNTDEGERIALKWILERQYVMVWNGLIWLRIVTSGGLL